MGSYFQKTRLLNRKSRGLQWKKAAGEEEREMNCKVFSYIFGIINNQTSTKQTLNEFVEDPLKWI